MTNATGNKQTATAHRSRRATALEDIWGVLPQFSAAGGKVRMRGKPIQLKGASWFGAEGVGKAPDGLWVHNVSFYLRFLAGNGFNLLRLPFALDNVLSDAGASTNMLRAAPELRGRSYLQILEHVVDIAARNNILVLFDLQRLASSRWPDDGLWYTDSVSMDDVKTAWERVQMRFCSRWNTLGADLLNEPHGATWAEWMRAASDLGNFVLSKCSRWVLFVEGVAHERKDVAGEYFWGENLADAGRHPVRLQISDRVVYSPHVYGPGNGDEAHHMPYFDEKDFPRNMEKLWQRHFGHLVSSGATVVVGEWGGTFQGKDRQWQEAFSRFLRDRQLSSIYWSLNPNSEDTGGLLMDDWSTPHSAKLSLLRSHASTNLATMLNGQASFRCPSGPSIPPYMHRCADASAEECILVEQVCNGVYECRDRSDEWACHGRPRPCTTVSGGHPGQLCVFPFSYNGFMYDSCTLVDSTEVWTLVGAGRCQRGYVPSLAATGITLAQCQEACTRVANCSFISYSASQAFCSGYSASCESISLHAGGGYSTHRFNDDGGAWCATAVGAHREYLGRASSGNCGPGCARPKLVGEPSRSRCMDAGAHSDGGPAHCAPSPPPPPGSPPPPNSPPIAPPPSLPPPPSDPPPWLSTDLLVDPRAIGILASVFMCALCVCWARVRQTQLSTQGSARRRRAGRPLSTEELQSLACIDEPAGPFASRRMPSSKRPHGRRDGFVGKNDRQYHPVRAVGVAQTRC